MMKRKKVYLFILSILMLNLFVTFYAAQAENLKSYKGFFDKKLEDYKEWLEGANLSNIISIDSLEITPDKVFLRLKMPDKHNWMRLNEYTSKAYRKQLADILFDQFSFQADLKREQLEIKVDGKDALVLIYYENNKIVVEMPQKMGPVSDNIDIPINELKILSKTISVQSKGIPSEVKENLKEELKNFFAPYKAMFSNYRFDIIYDVENELIIDVSNVVNVILDDEYFERIRLNFNVSKNNNVLSVTFSILGKYASGIVFSPKDSRYRNMEPDYIDQLQTFSLKLKTEINKILNKKSRTFS